jgi:DNA repair protein RadC
MKNLLPDDRPREKLRHHGAAALGDNELVALVLGNGSRRTDVLAVANALLAAHGGLHGLTRCDVDDLVSVAGIGHARAAQIVAALELVRTAVLASGTLNSTVIEPRDVFREAAIGGATAIVVFHNHPSGDPTPSEDDVDLTRRLAASGVLIGIDVIDHVVLGDSRYFSFKESAHL